MRDNPISISLYGRDYSSVNDISVQLALENKVALGMSVGLTNKPNEDALGIGQLGNGVLFAIADGHWGQEASEVAIAKSLEIIKPTFRPPQGNEMRGRLYVLFEQINSILFNMAMEAPGAPTPETTLIVCYLDIGNDLSRLFWASFGDSYLFVKNAEGKVKQLNSLNRYWLGALSKMAEATGSTGVSLTYPKSGEIKYASVATGLETGITELSRGDILFLCTDGLIDAGLLENHLAEDDLIKLLSKSDSLQQAVYLLMQSALERGGKDNISCILAEI